MTCSRAQRWIARVTISAQADQSIKHLIESLGVPHTEIGSIFVNNEPVEYSYLVQPGDDVAIYPETSERGEGTVEEKPRFILDNHLGRLAAYLRILGFDALYRNDFQDDELALRSEQEGRILLTRDKRLLMRNQVTRGYWLRSKDPRQQLQEVVERYRLAGSARPFQRCVRCNEKLVPARKQDILHRLEPLTRKYFDEFHICPACQQVYWKGSHYERMSQLIDQVLRKP